MSTKDKIVSTIQSIEGKNDTIITILKTIEQFFENLHVEVEDWKISTEEFREGTRIFVRFQIIVKKREDPDEH